MQDIEKKRNSSEPNSAKSPKDGRSSRSTYSASDAASVFGGRKKVSSARDDDNALRGLSKRFDRLSAQVDEDHVPPPPQDGHIDDDEHDVFPHAVSECLHLGDRSQMTYSTILREGGDDPIFLTFLFAPKLILYLQPPF